MSTNRRIAVFRQPDMLAYFDESAPIVASAPTGEKLKTSGNLERALELGYEVYVISTRMRNDALDNWWIKLVNADNVIFPNSGGLDGQAGSMILLPLYKVLYARLGLPWDDDCTDWFTAHYAIGKHGIKLGSDFSERQLELKSAE